MRVRNCTLSMLLLCFVMTMTGCTSVIRNNTPSQIPQNGSEVYTLAMSINQNGMDIISDSCSARIVIDGEIHNMSRSEAHEFTYNYKRPFGKHRANYYYELDYKAVMNNRIREKSDRSKLYSLIIANRYAAGFESNRGIPGTSIVLLGRGFEEGDYVEIGGVPCETTFISQNSLSFVVPMLGKNGKCHAILVSDNGDIGLGNFYVDQVTFHVNLEQVDLMCGEKQLMVVTIDFPAPESGVLIDVTTNVPDSVIMNDIFIPAGARTATAMIQGGAVGSGMIYLNANGFEELKIPVEIISDSVDEVTFEDENVANADEEFLTL